MVKMSVSTLLSSRSAVRSSTLSPVVSMMTVPVRPLTVMPGSLFGGLPSVKSPMAPPVMDIPLMEKFTVTSSVGMGARLRVSSTLLPSSTLSAAAMTLSTGIGLIVTMTESLVACAV